jgi:hypothetical protein
MAGVTQSLSLSDAAEPRGPEPPTSDEPKTGLTVQGDGPTLEAVTGAVGLREIRLELHVRLTLDGKRVI